MPRQGVIQETADPSARRDGNRGLDDVLFGGLARGRLFLRLKNEQALRSADRRKDEFLATLIRCG